MRAPGFRDLGRLEALHSGHEHRCPDEQPHLSAKLLQAHVLHSELREELEQLMRKGRASLVQLLLDLGDEIVNRDEPLLFLLNRGHPTFCYHVGTPRGAVPARRCRTNNLEMLLRSALLAVHPGCFRGP